MTRPNDDNAASYLCHETVQELNRILPRVCDDRWTVEERVRLNQILDEDFAARQYYLKNIAMHSALTTIAGRQARCTLSKVRPLPGKFSIAECSANTDLISESDLVSPSSKQRPVHSSTRRFVAAIAALACCAALVFYWVTHPEPQSTPKATSPTENFATSQAIGSNPRLVAQVTFVSPSIRWQNPNESYALWSRVRLGQRLALERGQVELTYVSGARLLLTGPSEFLVELEGGKLRRGELVANVPQEGHGFTIETPNGKVIDLGTEFGVVVDDFGIAQVSVFEGKVETLPIGMANVAQRIELTSGRALQLTSNAIIPLDATSLHHHKWGDNSAREAQVANSTKASLKDDFRSDSLSSTVWQTIGTVSPTPNGLQLAGAVSERPYLITRQEFDPSHGAITVLCDVRFVGQPDANNASFAILTRSARELGPPGSDWQQILATFLRCGFKVDPDSGEGLLEAGTKYEASRELWNLSWSGFSMPQPGTLYRLEIRDDGLNVVFTVSLVDNPSVRKTIRCRSLFRGNHNFVALEGPSTSAVIVERLQIVQDVFASLERDQLVETQPPSSSGSVTERSAVSKHLDELLPANAVALAMDGFDGDELNSEDWQVLGDVKLQNGQVQLGLPNSDNHIDTWQRRPYLLTKRQYDPRDGVLTVVGQITFDENFLTGFGGSFAVMTRADNSHDTGPGWANSILQRGIRSTFWPAALGFDQSLEIFEKPKPNTISLLTAAGFQIHPRSRSYYFRVVDDGQMVELTIIDAENPEVRKTIRHATTAASPRSGHIGFESCWGSPTLLDNVRIFQQMGHAENESTSLK